MQVCTAIVNETKLIFTFFLGILEDLVESVCGWSVSILHLTRRLCERACGLLGRFSFVCDWACRLIEWVEIAVEWVCEEIIVGVLLEIARITFEYAFYALTWLCWLIDWIFLRWIDYLICRVGLKESGFLHVCVKVLERDRNNPAWNLVEVNRLLAETDTRLNQCDIKLCVIDFEIIETDEHQADIVCGFSGLFHPDHHWFTRHECGPRNGKLPITIFFVENIIGEDGNESKGCSIPATNYMLVDHEASNATIAHEIGHLSDIGHSPIPTQVMFEASTDKSVSFSQNQCCLIATSKYVSRASLNKLCDQ